MAPTPDPTRLARWPLVGREAELKQFDAALRDTSCGALLLCGPPGVGRSRLARECRQRAAYNGHLVSEARATEAASGVALGALAHLLRSDVSAARPAQLHALAIEALSPSTPPSPPPRRSARPLRPVLCIDDLHHLDTASVVLVRQLLDARRVFVLGTARTAAHDLPGAAVTAVLADADAVRRVDLAPLDRCDTELLLRAVLSLPVTGRALDRLHHLSEGLPLPLSELVSAAVTQSVLTSDGTVWDLISPEVPLTPHLAGLLRARIESSGHRRELEILAACGPSPLPYLLGHLDLERLDVLERAGVLTTARDGRRTTVQLAHPLDRVLLRHDMPETRTQRILLDHVAWIREQGTRRSEDEGRVAGLMLRATGHSPPGSLSQAVHHAARVEDLDRARQLLESVPQAQRRFESTYLLGQALFRSGDCEGAERVLSAAAVLAAGEREVLDTLAARVHNFVFGLDASTDECRAVMDAARPHVRTFLGHRELALLRGVAAYGAGDFAEALEHCTAFENPASARSRAPKQLVLRAGLLKALTLGCLGHAGEAVEQARAAAETPLPEKDDPYRSVTLQLARDTVLIHALTVAGRPGEALTYGARAGRGLRAFDRHASRWLTMALGRAALAGGRLRQARLMFAEVARAARIERSALLPESLGLLAAAAAQQGDLEAAARALEEAGATVPAHRVVPELDLGTAWLAACRGELGRAQRMLAAAAVQARMLGHTTRESLLLVDLTRLGGAASAAQRLSAIADERSDPCHLVRAALARAWQDQDTDRLLHLAQEFHASGADLLAAEAASVASDVLRTDGRARPARAAAHAAMDFLDRCQGALTPTVRLAHTSGHLTVREGELALLASRGMSNKQIGETLHISPRTVENHLHRIYKRLGITGRQDLPDSLRPQAERRDPSSVW
ncbi:LuxR C-terminal-related transcriptional regulator [Streptomyces sp. NPDC059918]|uniref:helix-turn-helix transcriptional regulator n=1 Tax=unclassified Streptomyces TaxID=2593676 RepID=UPI003648698D